MSRRKKLIYIKQIDKALLDLSDSLHTHTCGKAITISTGGSVQRAVVIQVNINKERGLAKNENPNQGSGSNES